MNSNGIIKAPISLHADVYPVLGVAKTGTYYDLGYICGNAHGQINRWAMYKPERTGGAAPITMAQRQANKVWTYNAPRPGTDWCRLTDFVPEGAAGQSGYNHNARSPLSGWGDWTIYISDLEMWEEVKMEWTNYDDGNAASWQMRDIYGTYSSMQGRLTENSATYINGGGSDMIPLSYLLGGVTSEYWRVGVCVYVEGRNWLEMFTSSYPLNRLIAASDTMSTGRCLPALSTNQFLIYLMKSSLGKKSSVTFRAFPVLVRNSIMTKTNIGITGTQVSLSGSNTQIYSAPTGATSFNITLMNTYNPTIPQVILVYSSMTADSDYVVGTVGTGVISGSASADKRPIIALGIFKVNQDTAITGTVRIKYNITISYGLPPRKEQTYSGTATLSSSSTFTANGTTYKGIQLYAGPAVAVTKCDQLVKV